MFFGHEYYRYPEVLVEMLGEPRLTRKLRSSKLLLSLIQAYIRLFGIPDVGYQLRSKYFRLFIKRLMRDLTSILDAGCGLGLSSFYLARKFPRAKIDAVDIDPYLVSVGRRIRQELKIRNVALYRKDITYLDTVDKYDLIICDAVIDHIRDDKKVLENFYKSLKKGGILYLTATHIRHTRRLLRRLGFKRKERGHVRDGYTETILLNRLSKEGFQIVRLENVWGVFGEGSQELYLRILTRLPIYLTSLLFPLLTLFSFLDSLCKNRNGFGIIVVVRK